MTKDNKNKPKAKKTPLPKEQPKLAGSLKSGDTSTLVDQQLQKDMAEQGVDAPSDITKALIDSSDGEEP